MPFVKALKIKALAIIVKKRNANCRYLGRGNVDFFSVFCLYPRHLTAYSKLLPMAYYLRIVFLTNIFFIFHSFIIIHIKTIKKDKYLAIFVFFTVLFFCYFKNVPKMDLASCAPTLPPMFFPAVPPADPRDLPIWRPMEPAALLATLFMAFFLSSSSFSLSFWSLRSSFSCSF